MLTSGIDFLVSDSLQEKFDIDQKQQDNNTLLANVLYSTGDVVSFSAKISAISFSKTRNELFVSLTTNNNDDLIKLFFSYQLGFLHTFCVKLAEFGERPEIELCNVTQQKISLISLIENNDLLNIEITVTL